MKVRNLFLILTLLMVSFTIMGVTARKPKLKTMVYPVLTASERRLIAIENINGTGQSSIFRYDASGKLSLVEWDETKTEYKYHSDSLVSFTSNKKRNKQTESMKAEFSESGYLQQYQRWYILSGDTIKSVGNFSYNDHGYLHEQTVQFNTGEVWKKQYAYENGDLVSLKAFRNNKPVTTTTWEYGSKEDLVKMDFNRFYELALNITGQPNKHLPTRKTITGAKGVVQLDEYYSYEFDSRGFVTKRITRSASNAFSTIEERFVYGE